MENFLTFLVSSTFARHFSKTKCPKISHVFSVMKPIKKQILAQKLAQKSYIKKHGLCLPATVTSISELFSYAFVRSPRSKFFFRFRREPVRILAFKGSWVFLGGVQSSNAI